MDLMKLITYIVTSFILALTISGGAAFYIGYSAGRGDLFEIKAYVADMAANKLNLPVGGKDTGAVITLEPSSLSPVMNELRALSVGVAELQRNSASAAAKAEGGDKSTETARMAEDLAQTRQKLAEAQKEEAGLRDELARMRQRVADAAKDANKTDAKLGEDLSATRAQLSQANGQVNACQQQVAALEAKVKEADFQRVMSGKPRSAQPDPQNGSIFFDSVVLKRQQIKNYTDLDLALSLEGVSSRSAKLAVNGKSYTVSFGQRTPIQHKDAACELSLVESDLEAYTAKFNISCKRGG